MDSARRVAYPSLQLITHHQFDKVRDVLIYEPRPLDQRMLAQQSVFTYHPEPVVPLAPAQAPEMRSPDMLEFPVAAQFKFGIIRDLANIGISKATLFPDLDGLSWDLNSKHRAVIRGTIRMEGLQVSVGVGPADLNGPQTNEPEMTT